MIKWIKSLFKKQPKELGCVAKHILQDIQNLSLDKWHITRQKGTVLLVFKHPDLKYNIGVFTWDGTEIIYINDNYLELTDYEFNELYKKLMLIREDFLEYKDNCRDIERKNDLKNIFPECFN